MEAVRPQSEALFWKIPHVWDPVPDWWLFERIDERLAVQLVKTRLAVQREMLTVQINGIERVTELLDSAFGK